MSNIRFSNRILAVLATLLLALMVGTSAASAQSSYPLAGLRFEGYVGSVKNADYDAYVENDGRIWQPNLPTVTNQRKAHAVSIKIAESTAYFNGTVCTAEIDEDRDGTYDQTFGRGNGIKFDVNPAPLTKAERDAGETIPVAYARISCDGGASSGFEIVTESWEEAPAASAAGTTANPAPVNGCADVDAAGNKLQGSVNSWQNRYAYLFDNVDPFVVTALGWLLVAGLLYGLYYFLAMFTTQDKWPAIGLIVGALVIEYLFGILPSDFSTWLLIAAILGVLVVTGWFRSLVVGARRRYANRGRRAERTPLVLSADEEEAAGS